MTESAVGGSLALARDVGGAAAASVASALPVFLAGTLAVQMQDELHFGPDALGAAVSVYFLGAAACSVPSGRLADRVGSARIMRWSTAGAAVVLCLLAMVTVSWVVLAGILLLGGVVSSATNPATNRFLGVRVSARRQGMAFGIKQSAVPAATSLAGLAVPGIALTVGWRWAFVAAGLFAALTALILPKPRVAAARPQARHSSDPPAPLAPLIVLAIGFGLGILACSGIATFLVVAAVASGLSPPHAGLLTAVAGVAAIVGRVTTGILADRCDRGHLPMVAGMLGMGAVGYALLAAGTASELGWMFVAGTMVAFGLGWGWNGVFNFVVVHSYPNTPAHATGITSAASRLGGVVGPALFGFVARSASYSVAWIFTCGIALVSAGVVLCAGRMLSSRSR